MDRFDFIPERDNLDAEKQARLYDLIGADAPYIQAYTPGKYGYKNVWVCVMSRYDEVPDCITVDWCKGFAAEAERLTGKPICRVESRSGNKRASYVVPEDCLTIYDKDQPVYRNRAGNICRDPVAIIES